MARKVPTPTQRLRNNVMRQIKRMESNNYNVPQEVKEKLKTAPYQTLKSYQRDSYKKLYRESTAKTSTGETISGFKARSRKRSESAKKASRTREVNRRVQREIDEINNSIKEDFIEETEDEITERLYEEAKRQREESERKWEEERRRRDEEDRRNAQEIHEGTLIYNRILGMINEFPSTGAKSLSNLLKSEIKNYGFNNVMKGLASSPYEAIELAETAIYTVSGDNWREVIHNAFMSLIDIIRGTKPTDEEAKETGDLMDSMTDFEAE